MMNLAFNQKSCKELPLNDFIKLSRDFKGIELNFKELKNADLKETLELAKIYNLNVSSIFTLKDFSLCSDLDYKNKIIPTIKQILEYCYKLESDLMIIEPSKLIDTQDTNPAPLWRIINRTQKRLEAISKIAYKENVRVGVEFISNSSIPSMDDLIEVMKPLESQENLGYIIDTFHLIKSGADISFFNRIKDYLYLIRLCDLKWTEVDELSSLDNTDRLFPGKGSYNFKKLFKQVQKIRFKKTISIKIKACSKHIYKDYIKFLRKML